MKVFFRAKAQKNIFDPSMFGSSLEDAMEAQERFAPGYDVPWVITVLSSAILAAKGDQTEGIFRVPGDIDAVNHLKIQMDRGEVPSPFSEPHVPASALKLWFRELEEPLIPAVLYQVSARHIEPLYLESVVPSNLHSFGNAHLGARDLTYVSTHHRHAYLEGMHRCLRRRRGVNKGGCLIVIV